MDIFEISTKSRIFWCPIRPIQTKKSFHLLEGTRNFFENWKGQKWKKQLKISKNGFYKHILDFHCPSNILCHASKLWNFVKITGPYQCSYYWNVQAYGTYYCNMQCTEPLHFVISGSESACIAHESGSIKTSESIDS